MERLFGRSTVLSVASTTPARQLNYPHSLRIIIWEGIAWALMMGLGEYYLSPFGIFLKASPFQVALLASLPLLVGALSQLLGVVIMERFPDRRLLLVLSTTAQALFWLPIGLLPIVAGASPVTVNILILLTACYFACGSMAVPVWNSLVGDLVPAEQRGRFFASRSRWIGMAMVSSLVAGGLILHYSGSDENHRQAFLTLFILAGLARLCSAFALSRYENPEYSAKAEDYFSFWSFLRRTPHSNFARFVFFQASTNWAVFLAAPFFALYMLRELHFSYLEFMAAMAVGLGCQFMLMPWWGHTTDRFGCKRVLNVTGIGVTIVPILWLWGDSFWPILFIQVVAGFVWAGFNLAAGNFLFDAVSPPKRARCTAYLGTVNAALLLVGSLMGSALVDLLESRPPELYFWLLPASPYISIL